MKKENRLVSTGSKNNLVLGLNKDGKIVQFNQRCQKLTGYKRNEALNKKIEEFLIPTAYITKWKELFDAAVKNEDIADFEIPLINSDGEEVLISWSSLPLENKKGTVGSICFIGKNIENTQYKISEEMIKQDDNKNLLLHTQDDIKLVDNEMDDFEERIATHPNKLNEIIKDRSEKQKKINEMPIKIEKKNERLVRKNKNNFEKDRIDFTYEKSSTAKYDKISQASKKLLSIRFKKPGVKPEENNAMSKTVMDLLKKYKKINEKLKELEKKDRKLERKNKLLEKNLKNLKSHMKKGNVVSLDKKSQYAEITVQKTKKDKYSFKEMPNFFHDPLGVKRKREAFELRIHALDERAKELGELESQLLNDRKVHDKRIAEFTTWKEKLLSLEAEIEKRRKDIVDLEDALRENLTSSSASGGDLNEVSSDTEGELSNETVMQEDYHEIFDKISQSAVIVQRSIVKQTNNAFAELIGFETKEIINKSLFDFIAPEGLVDIEKYYLGRLKGNSTSTYETIFSTKENGNKCVEINIKPTIFNGEKAEMAVVQEMDDQTSVNNSSVNSEEISEISSENDVDDKKQDSNDGSRIQKDEPSKISSLNTKPSDFRIQEIIAESQQKKSENGEKAEKKEVVEPESKPVVDSTAGGAGGKMSQDAINAMLSKGKDDVKVEPVSEGDSAAGGAGGKMSQDAINAMIKKKADKQK